MSGIEEGGSLQGSSLAVGDKSCTKFEGAGRCGADATHYVNFRDGSAGYYCEDHLPNPEKWPEVDLFIQPLEGYIGQYQGTGRSKGGP